MDTFTSWDPPPEPRSTALTELSFYGCDIVPSALAQVLDLPRALKRLTFKGQPSWYDPSAMTAYTDSTRYADAVYQQRESLEFIDLDYFLLDFRGGEESERLDLTRLTVLREAHVNPYDIARSVPGSESVGDGKVVPFDFLPPTLETLVLEYGTRDTHPLTELVRSMSATSTKLGNIQQYTLLCAVPEHVDSPPHVPYENTRYEGSFTAMGVKFVHRYLGVKKPVPVIPIKCHCCYYEDRYGPLPSRYIR